MYLQVPHITAHISTSTVHATVTTTLPSPTPNRFRLYYNSTTAGKVYAGKVSAPGNAKVSEIGFGNSTRGDIFTLNRLDELVDVTFGRTITTRNRQDAYPFLFLNKDEEVEGDSGLIVPTCSVCSGILTCGADSQFAVCLPQRLLTLGPTGSWASNSTTTGACTFVKLGVESARRDATSTAT